MCKAAKIVRSLVCGEQMTQNGFFGHGKGPKKFEQNEKIHEIGRCSRELLRIVWSLVRQKLMMQNRLNFYLDFEIGFCLFGRNFFHAYPTWKKFRPNK